MNFKNSQFLVFYFLFLSVYSYSSVNIEVSRDSYLFSESKNSQIFKLNVILKDENGIIFNKSLSRNNTIFYKNLKEKKYSFIIKFFSYLNGKIENEYLLDLSEPGLYKVMLGKKNKDFTSLSVQTVRNTYAYRINDLHYIPTNTQNGLNKSRMDPETLKTTLRNLTLLYEQKIISKQEYLERRQIIISKYSK